MAANSAGFLYFFVTDAQRVGPAEFEAAGLGHALTGEGPDCRQTTAGPDGRGGVVAVPSHPNAPPAKFEKDKQTWRKLPTRWVEGKELTSYVGFYNDRRPGPADLARKRQIAGEAVKLRDGNDYVVPIARSVVRGSTLPRELVLGDDCVTWQPQDLPEFFALCGAAEEAFRLFHDGEADADGNLQVSIPYDVGMRISVLALQANYRVGPVEVSMLRLFADEDMAKVMRAVCDLDAYEQVMESRAKKESASGSSSTAAGSEA